MTSAVTKLACAGSDGDVSGGVNAVVPDDPAGFAADSVDGVNAAKEGAWTDVTVNALGVTVLRASGAGSGVDVADDFELNVLGG